MSAPAYPTMIPRRQPTIKVPPPRSLAGNLSPHASPWAQAPAGGQFNPIPRHMRPNAMFLPKPAFAQIPQVGPVPAPNWNQFAKPLQMLRYGGRMLPYVGTAMLALELIEWALRPGQPAKDAGFDLAGSGWSMRCNSCDWQSYPEQGQIGGTATGPGCETGCAGLTTNPASAYGTPIPENWRYIAFGRRNAITGRIRRGEVWDRSVDGPTPWVEAQPEIAPVPYTLPRPVPRRSPSPRWARRPAPDYDVGPQPRPNPNERPVPRYRAPPLPGAWWRPSLDVDIRPQPHPVPVRPGIHREVPPGPKEKEKKSDPLHGGKAAAWLKGMGFVINGFTETDDVVRAVYNSLPWQERRWKGRDGVWRDRDLYTHDKMARIMLLAERVDTAKMIDNITKTLLIDQMGGFLGRMNKAAIRANPYYAAKHGWQQGQRLTKANWEKLKADLRRAAVENNPVPGHNKWHRVYADDVPGSHRRGEKVIHPQQLGLPVSEWDAYYREQKWVWHKEEIPDQPFSLNMTYIPWLYRKTPVYYTKGGKLGYDRNALGNPNHYRWRNHHYFESND